MQTDVLIIGGGLSGIAAAWQLIKAGKTVKIIEARDRMGGRVLSMPAEGQVVDTGPSWFWPGQPLIAQLLNHFDIEHFPQFAAGDLLHQSATGQINRYPDFAPMANARRVKGGVSALVHALYDDIDNDSILKNYTAKSVSIRGEKIVVSAMHDNNEILLTADHVAIAIPPRIAAKINFTPALPPTTQRALIETPTWMAGHAKFIAIYDTPFWREHGLSGDIMSQRGPLAEVHDASPFEPDNYSGPYALFGFVGIGAKARAEMGEKALISAAIAQLSDVFGPIAPKPQSVTIQDWSTEPYTATKDDHIPLAEHPKYGPVPDPGPEWGQRLHFTSTETAEQNGGLLEGALERATAFVSIVMQSSSVSGTTDSKPRSASMSWEWIK